MPLPRNNRLCGATTRRGTSCQNPAMKNGRCRMHGGTTPRGVELPQFRTGRYSKALPDRMVERYEKALADEERHDLADEIALAEMKVDDLLTKMDRGESDELWIQLRDRVRQIRRTQDQDRRTVLLGELFSIISRGGTEAMGWRDVERWVTRKQRVVETDMRVAQTKQEMVSIEEVMALAGGILDAIRRHVEDQATRKALARDIRALGTQGAVVPLRRDGEESEE
jgi:glycine/D-amino acid oxidase-like deaminating enzyme